MTRVQNQPGLHSEFQDSMGFWQVSLSKNKQNENKTKQKKVVTWARHENPRKLSPMEYGGTGHCQAKASALRYAQWLEEAQAVKTARINLNTSHFNTLSPPFLLKYKES